MWATEYLSGGLPGQKMTVAFSPVKGARVVRGSYTIEWRGEKQFATMSAPIDGFSCLNDLPIAIVVHHKRGGWLCRTSTPGKYWLVTPYNDGAYTARQVLLHV